MGIIFVFFRDDLFFCIHIADLCHAEGLVRPILRRIAHTEDLQRRRLCTHIEHIADVVFPFDQQLILIPVQQTPVMRTEYNACPVPLFDPKGSFQGKDAEGIRCDHIFRSSDPSGPVPGFEFRIHQSGLEPGPRLRDHFCLCRKPGFRDGFVFRSSPYRDLYIIPAAWEKTLAGIPDPDGAVGFHTAAVPAVVLSRLRADPDPDCMLKQVFRLRFQYPRKNRLRHIDPHRGHHLFGLDLPDTKISFFHKNTPTAEELLQNSLNCS